MILQAKARPVRIRIKSGGEEHSSFESLKRHFCVKDLLPSAKDGRLSRWLRQQEKDNIAERVETLLESLLLIKEKTEIPEHIYIQFVLAFFNLEGNISSRQELSDLWSSSEFSDCLECQLLYSEIQQELAERKKMEDIEVMKTSYTQALLGYHSNRDICTQDEWIDIFESFKTSQSNDADYNWLMYSLTKMEVYLEESAKLGNENAIEILFPNRFIDATKQDFEYCFYSINNCNLLYANGQNAAVEFARKIKATTQKDESIKSDILCILEALKKNNENFNDKWLSKISILNPDASFLCGIFAEFWGKDAHKYYLDYSTQFALCKMRLEYLNNNKSICTICAIPDSGQCRYINISNFIFPATGYDKIPNLVKFIILHIFDKYTYEIR